MVISLQEATFVLLFNALHALHVTLFITKAEKAVRLSVCPSVFTSVKRMDCDKTEEIYVQIFIPYERPFILV